MIERRMFRVFSPRNSWAEKMSAIIRLAFTEARMARNVLTFDSLAACAKVITPKHEPLPRFVLIESEQGGDVAERDTRDGFIVTANEQGVPVVVVSRTFTNYFIYRHARRLSPIRYDSHGNCLDFKKFAEELADMLRADN